MLGAIAGDIIGSIYEHNPIKKKNFPLFDPRCRFTDDSVLTIAIADSILNNKSYATVLKEYCLRYPHAGYGGSFYAWATSSDSKPYNSWGNGSAMRVSPIGFAFSTLEEVLIEAEKSAAVTHNHPEGIKGAKAIAAAIYYARSGKTKQEIKKYIETMINYDLRMKLDDIRPFYRFDISCQGTVPQAIIAFLESTDFEDALRNAISLGGDSDTLACITGGIAEAFYGNVPDSIRNRIFSILDNRLKQVVCEFRENYL